MTGKQKCRHMIRNTKDTECLPKGLRKDREINSKKKEQKEGETDRTRRKIERQNTFTLGRQLVSH